MKDKGKYRVLIILVMFFLMVRLPILITSIDRIHFDEELYRGNIAKELISGPILPFFDYQRSEYEGGSLIMGILAVPFFILFGQTVFSLKLVALLFSVLTFIVWYVFLNKFFNRGVAILTGLLWILSPPIYTKWGLCSLGAYYELNFFIILAIYIFYQIFFIQDKKWLFALLGVVSGFAIFFSYMFLTILAVILLFWFIFDKKFIFTKNFFLFAIFLLLGFSPWIYFNLTHHFEGFIVADKPMFYWFTQNSLSGSWLRLRDVATTEFLKSFAFQDIGGIGRYLYYLIFAGSFFGILFINWKSLLKIAGGIISYRRLAVAPKEVSKYALLIVFPVIYFIILGISRFEFRGKFDDLYLGYFYQNRFFIPVYPFVFALTAIFCHRMYRTRRPFLAFCFGFCPILLLLILGVVNNLNMVSIDNFGNKSFKHTIYRGYNYYDLGKLICRRFSDPRMSVELIKRIKSGDDRRLCYAGMGWGFSKDKFDANYSFYIRNVLPGIDKQYWPDACERLGLIIGYNNDIIKALQDNLNVGYLPYFYRGVGAKEAGRLAHSPAEYVMPKGVIEKQYLAYFYEGMGRELYEMFMDDTESFLHFNDSLDLESQASVYKGIAEGQEYYQFSYYKFGAGVGKVGYNIKAWKRIIDKIENTFKPYCYQRMGIEVGWRFIHGIKRYLEFLIHTDEKYRFFLYRGVGIGIGWRFGCTIDDCTKLIKEIDRKYWPYIYEGLSIGVSKRYNGYSLDGWAKEVEKIPPEYQSYFQAGTTEASDNRMLVEQ
jgi:hypothetical protein